MDVCTWANSNIFRWHVLNYINALEGKSLEQPTALIHVTHAASRLVYIATYCSNGIVDLLVYSAGGDCNFETFGSNNDYLDRYV